MSALDKYKQYWRDEDDGTDPIEQLRAFCSFGLAGQDWIDVEPFFDSVVAQRDALLSAEPVAWAYYWSDGGLCAIELTRRDPKDSDEVVEVPLFTRKRYEA